MNACEVNCVRKSCADGAHESITHIGHLEDRWRLTLEAVIVRIEKKTHVFYVRSAETREQAFIEVVREPGKAPYLQARVKGRWTNDLLAQPECGPQCSLLA